MQKFSLLILLSMLTSSVIGQTFTGSIMHDGIERDYIIHLPLGYDDTQSYPFVYNLHGITSSAQEEQFYTGMDATADANGFIVCYPNGVDNAWNVNFTFGGSDADDVGFLTNLVDSLSLEYNINQERIYSCGMSNGGYMSYKLACEASDRFAAIASVTGSMVPSELDACEPGRRIPVMQIHGTADLVVPYNGSDNGVAIEDLLDFWLTENGCQMEADTIPVENISTTDGCTATRIEYNDCADETKVLFYKIQDGGHTWPLSVIFTGVTNRDFSANQEIWNFFDQFDINGSTISSNENISNDLNLEVFPNPTHSELTIQGLPTEKGTLSILNIQGQIVSEIQLSGNATQRVATEQLEQGMYFLNIKTEKSTGLVKFMRL